MRPDDRIRIVHMIDAADAIAGFVAGPMRHDLDTDRMLLFALNRAIEIMGEAAARLSTAFRAAEPAVPWALMIGMRNRVIHAYFDIDADILWRTVTDEIPRLRPILIHLADSP